jgi:O-antigen/teichoic acid export membrane protein
MLRVKLNDFYMRSGLFGLLSLGGAFFNYALYPVLVRILDTQQFGDFAAITAISNQILGILFAFNIISIYLVKGMEEGTAKHHAQNIQRLLIWFFLTLTAAILIFSPFLKTVLRVEEISSFFLLSALLVIAVPGNIWNGYLQGHKELVRIGISALAASIGKFVFSTLLAALFGVLGGIWGIIGGAILGLLVLHFLQGVTLPTLRSFFHKTSRADREFLLALKSYVLICIFVVGTLSFLQNFDIILAKALFDRETAGIYSGVSVLSNALYFMSFLLIWIILPEIQLNNHANNKRILATGYKLLVGGGLAVLTVEIIGKDYIAKLLLGPEFSNQGMLLVVASLYQLTLVGIALYAFYLLVCKKARAGLLACLALVCSIILPNLFGNSPLSMVTSLWLGLLAALLFYFALIKIHDGRRPLKS